MDHILTARDIASIRKQGGMRGQAAFLAIKAGVLIGPPQMTASGVEALAYVNAGRAGTRPAKLGRWVARCPDSECRGVEYVDPKDPIFMCLSCFNEHVGGQWVKVKFPDDREQIETVLLVRPPMFQNWLPDETIEDLNRENREHGIEEV